MMARSSVIVATAGLLLVAAVGVSRAAGPLDQPGFAKALTCSACHGAGGNSKSSAMPILAGMSPAYFKKQMEAYAKGDRPSAEMEPYAKYVLQAGVDQVAAYFAAQRMEPTPVTADPAAVARGRAASAECVVCHGPEGKGDPAKLIPSLAGQPPGYLREQMSLFKQDTRNPKDATLKAMKVLMRTIPDDRVGDLAAYYSSLR
jgi:cytochrome c553